VRTHPSSSKTSTTPWRKPKVSEFAPEYSKRKFLYYKLDASRVTDSTDGIIYILKALENLRFSFFQNGSATLYERNKQNKKSGTNLHDISMFN
jgi:hypothetical protein